jgi:hypothetical protein
VVGIESASPLKMLARLLGGPMGVAEHAGSFGTSRLIIEPMFQDPFDSAAYLPAPGNIRS